MLQFPSALRWLLCASFALAAFCAQASSKDETVVLAFAGDIMLDDLPGKAIAKGIDPFKDFANVLHSADAAIGNLECVVSTKGKAMPEKPWTFQPHPRVLPALAKHFGIVTIANNHTGDFGPEAFNEQLDLLDKHQIKRFGGGHNSDEARTPYILTVKGIRIALLGYNDFQPRSFEAGPSWPGVAWCVVPQVIADIKAAREIHKADLVIPFMHWGEEQVPANDRQKKIAKKMIDAGADLVVGSHPHWTQEPEYYKGKLVLYSLGNFVFDGFHPGGPERIGWVLRVRLDRRGLINWDTVVAHIDDEGLPHVAKDDTSPSGDVRDHSIEPKKALIDSAFTLESK